MKLQRAGDRERNGDEIIPAGVVSDIQKSRVVFGGDEQDLVSGVSLRARAASEYKMYLRCASKMFVLFRFPEELVRELMCTAIGLDLGVPFCFSPVPH